MNVIDRIKEEQAGFKEKNEQGNLDQQKALVGIFETEDEAINVIRRLKESGYQENEIAVLAKDKEKMEHIDETMDVETKSQDTGGKVGAGATVTVGAAGGLLGVLAQMGVGKEDAKEYETHIAQGKILVLVENRENLREDVHTTFNENNSMSLHRGWQR